VTQDIAWAAGFFEGEGSAVCTNGGKDSRWQRSLSVTGTDRDTIDRFKSIVGCGAIYTQKRRKEHWKTSYRWHCGKWSSIRNIVFWFYPYMSQRRRAAMDYLLDHPAERVGAPHGNRNALGVGKTRVLKTHCKYGHGFTPENTYVGHRGPRHQYRSCRVCLRNRDAARPSRAA